MSLGRAVALVDITANVSDEGRALVMAKRGDKLIIISESFNGTLEVQVEDDPLGVTFYAQANQIEKA